MDQKTTENTLDVVEIAKKQRYASLLRKMKNGKALTTKEIDELAKHEKQKKNIAKGKGKSKSKAKAPAKKKLSAQRDLFCREYIVDRNATQAAIRAEYSEKTAGSQGQRLLKIVEIQERIAELEKPVLEKLDITAEGVLQGIANIAFLDTAELFDENGNPKSIHDIPLHVRQAIDGIDMDVDSAGNTYIKKFRTGKHLKALELLGKTEALKLFAENLNVKLPEGTGVLLVPQGANPKSWEEQATTQQKKKPEQDA